MMPNDEVSRPTVTDRAYHSVLYRWLEMIVVVAAVLGILSSLTTLHVASAPAQSHSGIASVIGQTATEVVLFALALLVWGAAVLAALLSRLEQEQRGRSIGAVAKVWRFALGLAVLIVILWVGYRALGIFALSPLLLVLFVVVGAGQLAPLLDEMAKRKALDRREALELLSSHQRIHAATRQAVGRLNEDRIVVSFEVAMRTGTSPSEATDVLDALFERVGSDDSEHLLSYRSYLVGDNMVAKVLGFDEGYDDAAWRSAAEAAYARYASSTSES